MELVAVDGAAATAEGDMDLLRLLSSNLNGRFPYENGLVLHMFWQYDMCAGASKILAHPSCPIGDFLITSFSASRLPVTLDAISSEGPVGLEEDGVLHAGVVHRSAFQAHFFGDSCSWRRLRVWGRRGFEYFFAIRKMVLCQAGYGKAIFCRLFWFCVDVNKKV